MRTLLSLAVVALTSCAHRSTPTAASVDQQHLVNATLWQQSSGEAKALFYQGYNSARRSLESQLASRRDGRPAAIILDLDETVLDNSPYQARTIRDAMSFPEGWSEWVREERAQALPGAIPFLRYADSRGVAIFYVTNRRKNEGEQAPTMRNLRRLGAPQVRDDRMFLLTDTSSKESRRRQIAQRYDILLLIGDQLGDFEQAFEKQSVDERNAMAHERRGEFGERYIILPNPMYGDYEQALYGNDSTPAQRASKRLRALRAR